MIDKWTKTVALLRVNMIVFLRHARLHILESSLWNPYPFDESGTILMHTN